MEHLFRLDPGVLVDARMQTHLACQWASRAARANLATRDDDSHSNLGWHEPAGALVSRHLDAAGQHQVGFSFDQLSLVWICRDEIEHSLPLEQITDNEVSGWVNARLADADLVSAEDVVLPYELDKVGAAYSMESLHREISLLADWFRTGFSVLDSLSAAHGRSAIAAPVARCWPHHYDVGVLFSLEEGDPETSRSIGVGLSPGDGSYREPYFYCNPWPAPAVADLPAAPNGLRWHTDGFISLVGTASSLRGNSDFFPVVERGFLAVFELLR